MSQNIDKLLKGRILVKEVSAPSSEKRTWIEVALHSEDLPAYPFRTEPYAMTSASPYRPMADVQSRFKVRTSTFDAEEIRQGYDPSYEEVGDYEVVDSLQRLETYLAIRGIAIDDMADSAQTEYPL